MNTIIALYVTIQTAVQDRLSDDRGQTSMEWLGIAAVIIAIMVALAAQSDVLSNSVRTAFTGLVERVTQVQ